MTTLEDTLQRTHGCHVSWVERATGVQGDLGRAQAELEQLRARVAELEGTDHEPGEPIAQCSCPYCGASLEIEYGDDEGEISVVGESPPVAEIGRDHVIAEAARAYVAAPDDDFDLVDRAYRVLRDAVRGET